MNESRNPASTGCRLRVLRNPGFAGLVALAILVVSGTQQAVAAWYGNAPWNGPARVSGFPPVPPPVARSGWIRSPFMAPAGFLPPWGRGGLPAGLSGRYAGYLPPPVAGPPLRFMPPPMRGVPGAGLAGAPYILPPRFVPFGAPPMPPVAGRWPAVPATVRPQMAYAPAGWSAPVRNSYRFRPAPPQNLVKQVYRFNGRDWHFRPAGGPVVGKPRAFRGERTPSAGLPPQVAYGFRVPVPWIDGGRRAEQVAPWPSVSGFPAYGAIPPAYSYPWGAGRFGTPWPYDLSAGSFASEWSLLQGTPRFRYDHRLPAGYAG